MTEFSSITCYLLGNTDHRFMLSFRQVGTIKVCLENAWNKPNYKNCYCSQNQTKSVRFSATQFHCFSLRVWGQSLKHKSLRLVDKKQCKVVVVQSFQWLGRSVKIVAQPNMKCISFNWNEKKNYLCNYAHNV